ncbi:MAG: PorP/SprF family type IX secretion system membrane protein [Bacteroidetes bacterium]|nr:PorP/SprF family type IX secretion system membrane protein [Bacteroidota bacterium]MBU1720177.1 PorP/SprF family type IX secretion system membrane protein [Bacteroidota bacterium]
MKRNLCILIFSLIAACTQAQTDPLFSQHIRIPSLYNPAYSVPDGKLDVAAGSRQQWIGLHNAPVDFVFSGNLKLGKSFGTGLIAFSDKVGFENTINAGISAGYVFRLRQKFSVAIGLRAGILSKTLDGTKLIYEESIDQNGVYNLESELQPDFSAGMGIIAGKFSVGFSATHLLQSLQTSSILKPSRHYYGSIGYSGMIGDWKLTPGCAIRSNEFITQGEAYFIASYKKQFHTALVVRLPGIYSVQFGIALTDRVYLGYSYDIDTKGIRTESAGSHELIAQYIIPEKVKKKIPLKSTRFF